jgi:predicted nucleic acid-binding protein
MSEGAMRAIDTNVLVRMIVQDGARQAASAKFFVESGAWVSILALAEATWVLSSVYELSAHIRSRRRSECCWIIAIWFCRNRKPWKLL